MVDTVLHATEDFDDKLHPHQMVPVFMTPSNNKELGWLSQPVIERKYVWSCMYCDLTDWVTHREAIKRHWAKEA